jgi:hypothetical protein
MNPRTVCACQPVSFLESTSKCTWGERCGPTFLRQSVPASFTTVAYSVFST